MSPFSVFPHLFSSPFQPNLFHDKAPKDSIGHEATQIPPSAWAPLIHRWGSKPQFFPGIGVKILKDLGETST